MAANSNWVRWIFASVAYELASVAKAQNLAVLVEHLDERTDTFMKAEDRAEIRITGPFSQEISKGYHRIHVDANVLITSRYGGSKKNAHDIFKWAGLFHERLSQPIPIWNYGNEVGDYLDSDPDTHRFLGCLQLKEGKADSIKVFHFGQTDKTDKLKQSAVDARLETHFEE